MTDSKKTLAYYKMEWFGLVKSYETQASKVIF